MKPTVILISGNYYGTLHVLKHDNKFYCIIENYNTNFNDINEYDEISEELYNALLKHNDTAR